MMARLEAQLKKSIPLISIPLTPSDFQKHSFSSYRISDFASPSPKKLAPSARDV